ncbi:Serine/threonine protein kinase [Handroanthus impetiginosus]|uniref:Serine/threonine protein kinase n=1 Tax=Handroanthus impetiginosus TaxID=429701 RepID=A0A2G9G614_9LAMI|nr:Serine/threonine protein kinase [Handroanthus impetiginosus]
MQNAQNPLFSLFLIALTCSYFINPCYGNAELKALMEMKSSLDPANKYLSSWTPDGDPCSGAFEGVACNEHQKVANISLQGKGLAGKVPPAVAELKCLSGLYLHYNSLRGEIPKEIANLTELTDLYLNVNNLSGSIPYEIGSMASLQVLQLCCNSFTGSIPTEMGFLKKLTVLTLENNRLTGQIPPSLGDLRMLKRLYMSSNQLSGPIPFRLANLPSLEVLDLQNNTLSGVVPPALQRIKEGFHFANNPGLCGTDFPSLRACNAWDNLNANQINSSITKNIPQTATFPITTCNQTHCSKSSSKLPQIAIVAGVITLTVALTVVVFVASSIDQAKDLYRRSPSPLVSLEYSEGWDPTNAAQDCNGLCHEFLHGSKFNLEEVESATQHFSSVNLLGKSKFSAVYKGILKDGSIVAIKSISKTSCKTDEDEFMKGLSLLNSLKHENLVKLKGFCCSKARGECFLIYEFASKGNLSTYFDADEDGSTNILDWPTRISIIHGIARGIEYLHSNEIIHQNISVEKVVLDQQLKPLILDSGLLKLLADDVVYSALKVSAALGYMAPEYITTGRFTEKSDVYAYGVIILQLLSGQRLLSGSMRMAAECGNWEDLIDSKLEGKFSETEAKRLTKIALDCTNEVPENRPNIASLVQEFNVPRGG